MLPRSLAKGIKKIINQEVIRRLLVNYFKSKDVNYDVTLYPPMIADFQTMVPQLASKVEVVPYSENIDPQSKAITVGWNLFVLGAHRMYLGSSTHQSLSELTSPTQAPDQLSGRFTPRDVVNFVTDILGSSEYGNVDLPKEGEVVPTPESGINRPRMGFTASAGYYEKKRPV